jgi:hypothetical protein
MWRLNSQFTEDRNHRSEHHHPKGKLLMLLLLWLSTKLHDVLQPSLQKKKHPEEREREREREREHIWNLLLLLLETTDLQLLLSELRLYACIEGHACGTGGW